MFFTITMIIFSNEDSRKRRAPWSNSAFAQPSPVFIRSKMDKEVQEDSRGQFFDKLPHDADFQCPRCGQGMEEPRLLPCLHPICSPCVYELMSRRKRQDEKLYLNKGKHNLIFLMILM